MVGASRRRGSIGGELFRNILAADFLGAAHPVNREGEPVAGVLAYRSIADIPSDVDLAVISLPAAAVLGAAEDALRKGVKALVVISAGFAEIGSEGAAAPGRAAGAGTRPRRAADRAELPRHRVRVPSLNATFAARSAPRGNIGFSSQSGALAVALLEAAEARGLGLSAFVSIGNKADVSSNDLLEWWEDDPATDVVLLYVESFGNPRRFARLARRVARRKPMLALKSGTTATGQRAASSHTAALAGSEAAVDALFHQAGVIRASSLEELVDVAALLSSQPEPKGRRSPCSRTPAGSGSSAPTPARRPGSSCRRSLRRRSRRSPRCSRRRRASRIRSTCSAGRPPPPTPRRCRSSSPTRWLTPSSSSSSRPSPRSADEVAEAIERRVAARGGARSRCSRSS